MILVAGIVAVCIEYKRHSCSHDRAEILSGFGILLLCTGVLEIAIRIGDPLGCILIISGLFVALAYGIEHIRARRIERRQMAEAKEKR